MITFDRLKIVGDLQTCVPNYNIDRFEMTRKEGTVASLKYFQERPFLLKIKLDLDLQELVLEFTGKILGKNYPELISVRNIIQCFETIESLGFIQFDKEALLNSEVVKCDVTKDILAADMNRVSDYIRSHISNYHQFICRRLRNGNIIVEKNVTSKKTKKRMTIYDKEKEMQLASNKKFCDKYQLNDSFSGLCRFELNLDSKQQVRQSLNIYDNKLMTVLSSKANPILDFLDEVVIPPPEPIAINDKKSYITKLILKDCDYDLAKVEALMRKFHQNKGTNISKVMEPFRVMSEIIQMDEKKGNLIWEDIRRKLA